MDLGLAGAAVVVAGGTSGMGRAAADCFAADGARVAVLARSQAALDATAAELTELGSPDAVGVSADLFDGASVDAAIAEIGERWGQLNAAGERRRADGRRPRSPSRPTPTTSGSRSINGLTLSSVRTIRAALPLPAPGRVGPDRQRVGDVDQAAVRRAGRLHRGQVRPHQPHQEPLAVARTRGDPREHGEPGHVRVGVVQGGAGARCRASTRTTWSTSPGSSARASATTSSWVEPPTHPRSARSSPSRHRPRNTYMTGANINVDGGSDFT